MKIDRAVCADVGRKPSSLYMKHPSPRHTLHPLRLAVRENTQESSWNHLSKISDQRLDRSCPLSVSLCERYKEITEKEDKLNEDVTENDGEREWKNTY